LSRFLSGLGVFALIALSLGFAFLNSSQRVTLRLGVATLYGVPLTAVAFASVITGMVVMLIAGIRSDLKVRKVLRARLADEDRAERERFEDASQQDLFSPDDDPYGDTKRLTH
jgi:uncharacterized integral membrane protein